MTLDDCILSPYNSNTLENCEPFICDRKDLNDFFKNDAINYSNELLGKTYCFTIEKEPTIIVAAFTIANDSIKTTHLPNSRKQKVNRRVNSAKRMRSYPAVLIGRLGVNKKYAGCGIGSDLMNFIKSWFIHPDNKTGCRFIVADAYNNARTLNYYSKNGFEPLFSTEEQEREYLKLQPQDEVKTRLMCFDLITLTDRAHPGA